MKSRLVDTSLRRKGRLSTLAFYVLPVSLALALSSCLTEDGFFSSVAVEDFALLPSTINHGASARVVGTITSDSNLIAPDFSVYDEDGTTELVNIASVTLGAVSGKSVDLEQAGAVMQVTQAACAGHYLLRMVARDRAGERRTVMAPFTVTNPNCTYGGRDSSGTILIPGDLRSITPVLGNIANPNPGSIDLDNFSTYTHSQAKANPGGIDLYFGRDPNDLGDRLFSPAEAKARGIGATTSGPATWTSANATAFKQINMTQRQFEGISSQADMDALWSGGTTLTSSLVVVGNTYVIRTDRGKIVVIRVSAFTAGEAGTLTLSSYQ